MKFTKRILALLMAMLMLCSGMVVTAFADGETTEGGTTTTTPVVEVVKHTLNADNCYVDIANVEIVVKAAKAKIDGTEYDVIFSATQADDNTKTLRGLNDPVTGDTIFTNPTTGKNYNIIGTVTVDEKEYIAADKFVVEVLKSQAAPAAPVAKKVTSTSIEINSVSNCEYRINGGKWQASNVFTGLTPATAYKIEMRYKKTTTQYASDAVALTVKTLAPAGTAVPSDLRLVDKTEKTLTVEATATEYGADGKLLAIEYSIDGGKTWQSSGAFTGLKAASTYTVVARYIHDKTVQEAYCNTISKEFITNSRENYPADLKKCTFKAADGDNYANESISITVVADTAPAKYDAQYGDTRYVPVYYTVSNVEGVLRFSTKDEITYTATFVPGDANANKAVEVKVYFQKEKCHGEDDEGNAVWVAVSEIETKTYKVNVGEVHTFFTDVKNFFLNLFNALFNTIPAAINEWLGDFDFNGAMEGVSGLLDMLGGMDLGALTGETK